MGIWSSIKKAVKKVVKAVKKAAKAVWRFVKGLVRVIVKLIAWLVMLVVNLFDLLLGFLLWPEKNLTLHVVVLTKPAPADRKTLEGNLAASIEEARRILKERFNVKLRPYAQDFVEFFEGDVPDEALNPPCCSWQALDFVGQEFLTAGEFYADHTAGWNASPVSLRFPITAFVVDSIECKAGCSAGVFGEHLVVTPGGLKVPSLLMHEMGHNCSLGHSSTQSNIMYPDSDRGDGAKGFQQNFLRSSRHVTYW